MNEQSERQHMNSQEGDVLTVSYMHVKICHEENEEELWMMTGIVVES